MTLRAVAALIISAGAALAASPSEPPLPVILEQARKEQKPAVLYFSTAWCTPCKLVAEELETPGVRASLAKFVFQHYDAERGAGIAAAARYRVTVFPTFLLLTPDGAESARLAGYQAGALSGWLDEARLQAGASDEQLAGAESSPAPAPGEVLRRLFASQADVARCGKSSKGLAEALVRVEVDSGRRLKRAEVLEAGVSPGFRQCVEKALRAVEIPSQSPAATAVFPIPLRRHR